MSGNSLSASDEMAITTAAAETMQLKSNQVSVVSYKFTSTRRQLRDVETLASVSVTIQTSIPVNSTSSAASTYNTYSSKLNDPSVFDSNLASAATTYGATSLTSANATTITSTGYDVDQPGNDDDSNSLSGGAIAGIVIGVIIGVGLLAGIIWYFVASGGSSTGRANKSTLDIDVDL